MIEIDPIMVDTCRKYREVHRALMILVRKYSMAWFINRFSGTAEQQTCTAAAKSNNKDDDDDDEQKKSLPAFGAAAAMFQQIIQNPATS